MKKVLNIQGLNCANCAAKIENLLNNIDKINKANVNMLNQTITLEYEDDFDLEVISVCEKIIHSLEPSVIITNQRIADKKIDIDGLDCANCAAKIELALNENKYITKAKVDFLKQYISIQYNEEYENIIIDVCKNIVDSVEDGIIFKLKQTNDECNQKNFGFKEKIQSRLNGIGISEILWLCSGIILFILALFTEENTYLNRVMFVMSYLCVGKDVLLKAIKNIFKGKIFDENFLMTIATIGAFVINEYSEGVAVMVFYQIGEMFQTYAVGKSRKSISELMDIKPTVATLKRDNQLEVVSPEELCINDEIIIKPGEKVPVDGVVVDGESTIDTSALTGETLPLNISINDTVLSGSINMSGILTVKVIKEYKDSTVAKILDLVENATNKKASSEKFITKFARYYTPIVVVSAAMLALLPPMFIKDAIFNDWLYRALVFLVVSCPCALVISVPLAFFAGIGASSRQGVLVKGSSYLEALSKLNTIAFDKTGTLTKGTFSITEIKSIGISQDDLLDIVDCVESNSNHPIAKAIVSKYNKNIDANRVSDVSEIAGLGLKATVDGKIVYVGNSKLMSELNLDVDYPETIGTVIHISIESAYNGYIIISDEIKDTTESALNMLKQCGISEIAMLTGDNKKVGEFIANKLNIDKIYTELLPADKVDIVEELISNSELDNSVAFVGDGINDAPVLARADIGIAMGGVGSDSAIEAADVVIMNDDISKIANVIKIAKNTMRVVKQNIVLAIAVKIIVMVLSTCGMSNMWYAVFADVGVSVLAIINSIRILF